MDDNDADENFWTGFHQPSFSWLEFFRVMLFMLLLCTAGWVTLSVIKLLGRYIHVVI